jgi:hypothetical protein
MTDEHGPVCGLRSGEQLPPFVGISDQGLVDSGELRGRRALVLLFLPEPLEPPCARYLDAFASHEGDYRHLGAAIVVVSDVLACRPGGDCPFPVIARGRELFTRFGFSDEHGAPRAGVVITDPFGTVDRCYAADDCAGLPAERTIARVLLGAVSACPECGAPEQHWLDAAHDEGIACAGHASEVT